MQYVVPECLYQLGSFGYKQKKLYSSPMEDVFIKIDNIANLTSNLNYH